MDNQSESAKLKQFLLGNLAEGEAEEIGVRIIADRELDEKMSFAEEELVEDFLDDELTAEEKELFFANFLTTPARIDATAGRQMTWFTSAIDRNVPLNE